MANTEKKLNEKQQKALELLTSGKGLTYQEIADQVGVNKRTLWDWRNEPQYTHFQAALKKLNDERWLATVDAARAAALKLCLEGKTDMVKFILQNDGLNPAHKVEADVDVKAQVIFVDDLDEYEDKTE
jgi:hypothetical protein